MLEALGAIGATEAIPLIQPFIEHPVPRVQCAANRAMYQPKDPQYGERLVKVLDNSNLQLRRVALGDLGAIGYVAAADAIANATVENSFKLIALKGLLESQLNEESQASSLTDDAIRILNLMDSLL